MNALVSFFASAIVIPVRFDLPPDVVLIFSYIRGYFVYCPFLQGRFIVPTGTLFEPTELSACCVLCQQSLDFFNICDLLCDIRYVLSLLHRAIHSADVSVHDPDTLRCGTGILLAPLAHFDPLDEEPQQFWFQFVNGGVPFGLLNEGVHIGG